VHEARYTRTLVAAVEKSPVLGVPLGSMITQYLGGNIRAFDQQHQHHAAGTGEGPDQVALRSWAFSMDLDEKC
jgi:hypothetical protein